MPDLAGLNPTWPRCGAASALPSLSHGSAARALRQRAASRSTPIRRRITFCTRLGGKPGRPERPQGSRVSSATQSDWVAALGAIPVQTAFAEVVANLRSGNIDCAITGTMSGNAIGLHRSHDASADNAGQLGRRRLRRQRRGDGRRLPSDVQELLKRELPKPRAGDLNARRDRDPVTGSLATSVRARASVAARAAWSEARPSAADAACSREILSTNIPPSWLKRCGSTMRLARKQVSESHHRRRAALRPLAATSDALRTFPAMPSTLRRIRSTLVIWGAVTALRRRRRGLGLAGWCQRAEHDAIVETEGRRTLAQSGAEAALNRTMIETDLLLAAMSDLLAPGRQVRGRPG